VFYFKQFKIDDNRCAMKVGTDGVLLGAWVDIAQAKTALDVGTGSAVIALMLAQRTSTETQIDAIEVDKSSAEQAQENVQQSPWAKKIIVHHSSLQAFHVSKKYDLIVSNPPYFNNSLLPPEQTRAGARHTDTLPHHELLACAKQLLTPAGRLAVILPFAEGKAFISMASITGLFCTRQCSFYSRQGKPQERWLLEFALEPRTIKTENLLLFADDNNWSEAYKDLTRDFYLKL
jgi:tRNA1Val (adenine37-N6)-methyltransferase